MKRKKYRIGLLLLLLLLSLMGCGKQAKVEQGTEYQVYEMNKDETTIVPRAYMTQETDTNLLVKELIDQMTVAPTNTEMKAVIFDPVKLEGYTVTDETVTLNFNSDYEKLSITGEVLLRAGIVRTLTQVSGINYVSVMVEGVSLTNRSGQPIGMMTAEQFIDNSGKEINTEEKVKLNLYFANGDGDKLVKVSREVVYNSNISLEKLILEQLIIGTHADETEQYGVGMTINPDTKLNSVMVSDGVCYVNLDSAFLTQIGNVNAEITIYSIVNSLVELSNINKVQFLINGESDLLFMETMPLSETYERNLEITENI